MIRWCLLSIRKIINFSHPYPQVSADDSAEGADHIEINGVASTCSAAIFSPHVFEENGQLVHVKSQWRP